MGTHICVFGTAPLNFLSSEVYRCVRVYEAIFFQITQMLWSKDDHLSHLLQKKQCCKKIIFVSTLSGRITFDTKYLGLFVAYEFCFQLIRTRLPAVFLWQSCEGARRRRDTNCGPETELNILVIFGI